MRLENKVARAICDDNAVCSATTCDVTHFGELRDIVALAVERYGWPDLAVARPTEPDEIASVAVFLASGEVSYVTGQVIYAEGGGYC